jgi:bifunctional ADP-heptose synthase (sugar kinase/adenylyltransferase)
MTKKENIIVVSGEFDPISYNEFKLLKTCKSKCDWLIVGVHSDKFMHLVKGGAKNTFEQRKEVIDSFPFVDEVFSFNDFDQTSCNLLKLIKLCYPASNIIYVSEKNTENMPEARIRGITFTTYEVINQGV